MLMRTMAGVDRLRSMAGMEPPPSAGRPGRRGFPLGRVLGFPVRLNWSVLLLAALVTLLYGQYADYLVGFGFVVCLLVSVLLHELGHAVTARRLGVGVRGITLEILGGYTEMDREAPTPRVEVLVALAGPAVSLVLGLVAALGAVLLPAGTPVWQVVFLVALANIIVAFFNVLPGLPLDGGRALRAAVWAIGGDQLRGTLVAARTGQALAVVTAAGAAGLYGSGFFRGFGLVFMLLVAFTLWQGATASVRLARIRQRVPLVDLDELTRPVFLVASGTPLAEAQRRAAEARPGGAALAVSDSAGRLVALVNARAAAAVPAERRPWVSVDTVARDLSAVRTVPAGLRGSEAVAALQAAPAGEYLVTRGGEVVGVLHAGDVARALRPARAVARRPGGAR
jgi:Zn-dependent protease